MHTMQAMMMVFMVLKTSKCDAAGLAAPKLEAAIGEKVGCGWRIVRRVRQGANWHPSTDHCTGSQSYGSAGSSPETGSTTWSTTWSGASYTYFLFATGDFSQWMVVHKDQVHGNYENSRRSIKASSTSGGSYSASWYNRAGNPEDPWLSLNDHGPAISQGKLLYGAAGYGGIHASNSLGRNGANVYIAESYGQSCVTSTTTLTSTTTTTTVTTTTSSTSTQHQHIIELKDSVAELEKTVGNLRDTVHTLQRELQKETGATASAEAAAASASAALAIANQVQVNQDADSAALQQLRSLVVALLQPVVPPAFINPPATEDDIAPVIKCVADSPESCNPNIESYNRPGAEKSMSMTAPSGNVLFESAMCPETDLCEMSRKLEAVLNKFNPQV
jgi:uncharacterized coiled-coil protein SlyX